MAKHLPVPPELEHLIEKRDQDADRRGQGRRKSDKSTADSAGEAESAERPRTADRRRKRRRKSDS